MDRHLPLTSRVAEPDSRTVVPPACQARRSGSITRPEVVCRDSIRILPDRLSSTHDPCQRNELIVDPAFPSDPRQLCLDRLAIGIA